MLILIWGIAFICVIASLVCFIKHFVSVGICLIIISVVLFFIGVFLPQSEEDKKQIAEYRKNRDERKSDKQKENEKEQQEWVTQLTVEKALEPLTKHYIQQNNNKVSQQDLNSLRILSDSGRICSNTLDPDIYFSRYDLILMHLNMLDKSTSLPAKIKMNVLTASYNIKHYKENFDTKFLYRYWQSVIEKSLSMKTANGRNNQINKFYTSIQKFDEHLSKSNILLYQELYNKYYYETTSEESFTKS